MAGQNPGKNAPIGGKDALIAYLEGGCKPKDRWRIGTEHEKFAFRGDDHSPLAYEGNPGIREFLSAMQRFGWQPVFEGDKVIALNGSDKGSISLEPGGQVELSGAPVSTIHETCAEVQEHLRQVREVGKELGIGMIGIGFHPTAKRDDIHWMPKGRYKIMREYMPKRGNEGLDMMLRTCTVQVNLDYGSERDMARKMRVGMALQPIATAMFANSPFREGEVSDYQSLRSKAWMDTDPDRTGILDFVFDDGFGFEQYVDWLLDVPMYFVYRDGQYLDASGQSFRDFMAGKLPALPGEVPTVADWEDQLSVAFPEVRLKRFIEMRGADAGPWRRVCALPALWVGLLYDDDALDAAMELIGGWSYETVRELRDNVCRTGLDTEVDGRRVLDVAREALTIARRGLRARAEKDVWGEDETRYLSTLEQIVDTGLSPARHKAAAFRGRWGGHVDPAFEEYAY